jgi:hypothetical protein
LTIKLLCTSNLTYFISISDAMMKKKVVALCVVVLALLPLIFIMPMTTASLSRLPTDMYIGGLRGEKNPHQIDPGPGGPDSKPIGPTG